MKTLVRNSAVIGFLFLIIFPSAALDFSSYGFTASPVRSDADSQVAEFSSPVRGTLTVAWKESPGEFEMELINNTASLFYSWGGLELAELRMVVEKNRVDAYAVPRRYLTGGSDAASYMPSGMHFIITSHPEFDFRLKVGNLFIRMQGWFFNYDEFGSKVANAIQNPYAFIRSNDPEYLIRKSEEFERTLEDTKIKWEALEKEFRTSVGTVSLELARDAERFQAALETLTEQLRTGKAELVATLAETQTELNARLGDMSAAAATDIGSLRSETAALRAEVETLRNAVLVLHNRSLFGGVRVPDEAGVARVIALKKERPELTEKEIAAVLKTEGHRMSSNEISLVLAAFFGEY